MSDKKFLLIIGGPTASGKTTLAIRLARHFGTEILSCDSRQFFKEMSIGTAKPSEEELTQAPHHFINSHSIQEEYSVGDYEKDAIALLDQLFKKHEVVILTGGSGLYQKAVCEGLDEFPQVSVAIRQKVEGWYAEEGLEGLQGRLKEVDPNYYAEVDRQNPHRLIRALAVFEASGQAFSTFRKNKQKVRPFVPIYLELSWDRKMLYQRINQRVDLMMQNGLLDEVRQLYPHKHLSSLQTVGYQELFDYLDAHTSEEEAIELIKRNSRRYAKRQLTWTRRDGYWKHFRPDEWEETLEYLQLAMKKDLQFRKVAPSETLLKEDPSLDHLIQYFSGKSEKIGQYRFSEKKYKIYHHLELNEAYWDSREEYFFLQEIFLRLQNNDQLRVPDRLKPFFIQKGLVSSSNFHLTKK